ncbi:MAG: hypothetical protein HY720_21850 [Planctomycetes bacterium]|nr:hypothetical protein [Planctomycetota bacterium]
MGMEYYSFEKVLEELQMEEDELKRLVSEGEIRAFRDEDKMKFKKSDIDGLKKGRMTEPTIILPSSGGKGGGKPAAEEESEVLLVEDDTSETLLDIDDLDESDSGSASSTSVPTIDFSEGAGGAEDTGSETLTEELVFDDSSSELALDDSSSSAGSKAATQDIGSEETFVDDSSTGMTTEPLDLMDESGESSGAVATVQAGKGTRPGGGTGAPTKRPTAAPARRAAAAPVPAAAPPPAPGSPIFTAFLIAAFVFLFYSSFVLMNVTAGRDSFVTLPITNIMGGIVPPNFVNDKNINPQADQDTKKVSDGEKKWYKDWRAEPHKAISEKGAAKQK